MKKIFKLFLFVFTIFSIFIGSSNWVIVVEKNITVGAAAENHNKEVAYIESNPSIKYTRIEKALEVAKSGDRVIVISGSNPIIKKDCEIKSGVSLILPFNDKTNEPTYDSSSNLTNSGSTYGERWGTNSGFADSTSALVTTNKKLEVTIDSNVTLTNNGLLAIGGVIGTKGTDPIGQTSGEYAQITMKNNSKIISYGKIDCYGYIKEYSEKTNSMVEIKSGTLYMPLVFYDYRGGSSTVSVYMASDDGAPIFPFNVYDMPNIQCNLKVNAGSNVYGYVGIFTDTVTKSMSVSSYTITVTINARHNTAICNIIGPSESLINLSSGFILSKYVPKEIGITTLDVDGAQTNVEFNGQASFGYLSITLDIYDSITYTCNKNNWLASIAISTAKSIVESQLKNTTINSSNVFFPVPYKYNIKLCDGTYEISNKIKFLTGAQFMIEKNATLNISNNGNLILYSQFIDTAFGGWVYPSMDAVILKNKGIINVNKGKIGGIINSHDINAKLNIASGSTLELSSAEGYGSMSISTSVSYDFHPIASGAITETARGYTSDSESINDYEVFTSKSYSSIISTTITGVNYLWG